MSIWRKLAIVFALLLFGVGLWILGYDLWFIHHYGCDGSEVCSAYDDPEYGKVVVDWPTGERPSWTLIPLYAFSFPFFLVGILIFIIRPKPPYRGRIRSGTE